MPVSSLSFPPHRPRSGSEKQPNYDESIIGVTIDKCKKNVVSPLMLFIVIRTATNSLVYQVAMSFQ